MAKRQIGPLIGRKTRLRLLEERDLPMTLAWRNQDHIRKWFLHSDVITPEQHWNWFRSYAQRDDDFVFVIEETVDLRKPVGQISLYNIDWNRKLAEYGRVLIGEPDAAGRGLAKEATEVLLGYAFGPLGLQEVHLKVYSNNAPAVAIYRSCGFRDVAEENHLIRMIKTLPPLDTSAKH